MLCRIQKEAVFMLRHFKSEIAIRIIIQMVQSLRVCVCVCGVCVFACVCSLLLFLVTLFVFCLYSVIMLTDEAAA